MEYATVIIQPGATGGDFALGGIKSKGGRIDMRYSRKQAHERQHRFDDVIESVMWARKTGIDNLSLDLIFGLPDQPIEVWIRSLRQALNLAPEHFSLYSLTIEEGTPLHNWVSRGLVSSPNSDIAAEMYEIASEKLFAAGYVQYEISSWARANDEFDMAAVEWKNGNTYPQPVLEIPNLTLHRACHHNLQYWRNQPYLGFGAGAHGFVSGLRTSNVLTPKAYIHRMGQAASFPEFPRTPATVSVQSIDHQTEMGETMMMGLRLTQEGVSRVDFEARFDQDFKYVFDLQIERLIGWGLLEWIGPDQRFLRLTTHGRLLGNRVFSEFI